MKVARKRLLFLSLVLLVGTQPIINYTSEGNSPLASPSFTKLLFAGINSLFAYATSIAFSTYVSGWVQKYMMQQKTPEEKNLEEEQQYMMQLQKKIQEHQLKNIEQGQIKKPIPVKTTITFKDYIGVPKEAIQLVSQLKNPEKYEAMNVSIPHGILLTGDPGVGKTYLAQAIAGEVDCPFFEYSAADFPSKWVGESEGLIKNIFQTARDAAKKEGKNIAIIFIDEFDTIGKRSTTEESGYAKSQTNMINTFLTEMAGFEKDQIPVIVIAATNFPENIDPALRRPGRFDYIIHIPYPQKEDRLKLLKLAAQNKPIDPNIKLKNLAEATEGMSPADIKLLFDLAGTIALKKKKSVRDYDSFARAIWQIKEKNYMLKIASREDRKNLINQYSQKLQLPNNIGDDLLNQTTDMTLTDIQEIFERAYKYSIEQTEKAFIDWLWIALAAKKQQIQIRKNKDAFELCKKLYAPITKEEYTKDELLKLTPDRIFDEFIVLHDASMAFASIKD